MIWRRPKVIRCWLPFGMGLTLYPFIFIDGDERTFKHECMHWYQIERMGVFRFYWEILKEYIKHGSNDGPLEQECEKYETYPLNYQEQEWWYGSS